MSLATQSLAQNLPPIDAHRFKSIPIQISTSGRVYRFSMNAPDVPRVGSIVLIQYLGRPTMAFRVLQSDPVAKQYVARRVRRYDENQTLVVNRTYSGIEKIADKVNGPAADIEAEPETPTDVAGDALPAPPPAATPRPIVTPAPVARAAPRVVDTDPILAPLPPPPGTPPIPRAAPKRASPARVARIQAAPTPAPIPDAILDSAPEPTPVPMPEEPPVAEVQATPVPAEPPAAPEFDQNLDSSSSPMTSTRRARLIEERAEVDDPGSPYEIEESHRFDPTRNMISVLPGVYRNASNFVVGGELLTGVSFNYSHKLRDDWLIRNPPSPQDALWFELGLSHYRKAGLNNDVYTIVPIRAELRWEINFSEAVALQFFGGVQYNWAMSVENYDESNVTMRNTYSQLVGLQPTFGTGLLFHIGPQWYIRSDIGYDRVNFGLGIKW